MSSLSGLLLVDKPVGPTSHDVVSQVRKAAGIRRVGHAGTLDPFASGLLLVLLGQATRLSEYLIPLDKSYEATARLGIETTTHDPEGEVVLEDGSWRDLSEEVVSQALDGLSGALLQEPPRFSSKKVRGVAAHRRARRGETVTLAPVEITVFEIRLLAFEAPMVRFWVRCSSGTYIRALARDLGRKLGPGAHLTRLVRTAIGSFPLAEASGVEALENPGVIRNQIRPPAAALAHFPAIEVSMGDAVRVRQGQSLPRPTGDFHDGAFIGILQEGELLGVGSVEGDRLRPRKVLAHG